MLVGINPLSLSRDDHINGRYYTYHDANPNLVSLPYAHLGMMKQQRHMKSPLINRSMHCYLEYIGERGEPTKPGLARRPSDFFSDPGNQGLIMLLWSGVIFDRSSARKSSAGESVNGLMIIEK